MIVSEWCPHCEEEFEIDAHKPSNCPECGKIILPCSMCDMDTQVCGVGDESGVCNRFREADKENWK